MTILGKKILEKMKKSIESGRLKNEYKMLFTHFPGACMVCDFDGNIIEANEHFYNLMKYDREEMEDKSVFSFLKFKQTDIGTVYLNSLMKGKTVRLESDLITGDGQINDIEVTIIPVLKNDQLVGMFLVILDGSEKNQLKQDLTRLEETLSYEQQLARVGSWTYDVKRKETHISEGICSVLECPSHKFDGNLETLYSNVHENDIDVVREAVQGALRGKEYEIEYRVVTSEGTEKYVHEKAKVIRDEYQNPVKIIGVTQEINCYIDELTKLPNRAYFLRQLKLQTEEARTSNTSFALIMLDIDGFEYINGALGHQVGDQLLIQVSKRLKSFLGDDKFLCRYAEDQFAVIVTGFNDIGEYARFAREMTDLFSYSVKVQKYDLNITICMGISIYPDDGQDAAMIEKNANIALFRCKKQGKNRYLFHSSDMRTENYKQFVLRNDLCKAIERCQLKVYFQPQVNFNTNEIFAAEALVRWDHPHLGLVSPGEFIYIAEENGFIIEIGNWVLKEVCRNYRRWLDKGLPPIKVSINYSCIQFHDLDFVEKTERILEEFRLEPNFLIIEITESMLMSNSAKAVEDIRKLQDLGIKVALDDFGTGFSSLACLSTFNIDILKLDRTFIQDVSLDDTNRIIIGYIVNLAKKLGIEIVAEGIETWEQLSYLRNLNCCLGQGYLYSKPIPPEDFENLLARKTCRPCGGKNDQEDLFRERRKYFRVDLPNLLEADVNIIEIKGKRVEIGRTKALIKNIGQGGLAFISALNIPVKRSIMLQFSTQLVGHEIKVYGYPVWTRETDYNLYEYGIEFTCNENERAAITGILAKLRTLLENGNEYVDGRFVSETAEQYFGSPKLLKTSNNHKQ